MPPRSSTEEAPRAWLRGRQRRSSGLVFKYSTSGTPLAVPIKRALSTSTSDADQITARSGAQLPWRMRPSEEEPPEHGRVAARAERERSLCVLHRALRSSMSTRRLCVSPAQVAAATLR